jgi:hypothetical protein
VIRQLVIVALLLSGCAAGVPGVTPAEPPVVLLGDVPYSQAHANLLDGMIDDINREKPAFVVHLGDITGGRGPCTDEWFDARKAQFARFAAPFVLILGDNEWTDCHRSGHDPLERLAKVRALFHTGAPALPGFARQSSTRPEHTRWSWKGVLYVGLNVPGSNNNLGRTPAMDAEYTERMKAVFEWLDAGVKIASAPRFDSLVVMMQANPDFEGRRNLQGMPDGYAGLRAALERSALTLGKPFVLAHGDTHGYRNDRQLAGVPNLHRIEVDGWPALGWLSLLQASAAGEPFRVTRSLFH